MDIQKLNPKILKRFELLNLITGFVEEEKESLTYAEKLFEYYEKKKPDGAFTQKEREVTFVGLILADIGKTGLSTADEGQQSLIIRLFNIQNLGKKESELPIRDFLREQFSETEKEDLERLADMGIDPDIPMKQFWRLHSGWTLEIIEGDGIPEEDLPGAVLHHVLEGDNVDLIDENGNLESIFIDGVAKLRFGENCRFDRPEKLVVLLDKYLAFIKRLKDVEHEEAIIRIRKMLDNNQRFKNDSEFLELIQDIDKSFQVV